MGRYKADKMALDLMSITNDMESLVEMMEEAEELHGDKQGHSSSQGAIMGPGDIGPKKGKTAKKQAKKSDDIWDVDEVPEEDLNFLWMKAILDPNLITRLRTSRQCVQRTCSWG